ncbi:unnamed protein product, partial [marine sediment metagenome]
GHLYLDVIPRQILLERASRVSHWIELSNHPDPSTFRGFLPGDSLHPALGSILGLIGGDAIPLLLDSLRSFETWADTRPPEVSEPPRAVGGHETALRDVSFTRYTSAYTLWMVQRSLDAYRALSADDRRSVDRALAGTGCEALFAYRPRHRLGKQDFKLVFEASPGSS